MGAWKKDCVGRLEDMVASDLLFCSSRAGNGKTAIGMDDKILDTSQNLLLVYVGQ